MYWAEFMAKEDPEYRDLARELLEKRGTIVEELSSCQGKPVDIGGYYKPDPAKADKAMRHSATLNSIFN